MYVGSYLRTVCVGSYLRCGLLFEVLQGHCINVFCTVLKVNVQQMFCSISFTQPYNDHQEFTLPFL